MKSRGGKSQREEEKKKEDQGRGNSQKTEDAGERKGSKVAKTLCFFPCFFQWSVAPEGRKSRLAKAAGAEPSGQMRNEKVHAVAAPSTFPSQTVQKHTMLGASTFGSWHVEKSACCCGAKHMSKSKCVTHTMLGASTFGSWHVEKVHAIVARSTFPSQNDSKRTKTHHARSKHFWKLTCRKKCMPLWHRLARSYCYSAISVARLLRVCVARSDWPE